MKITQEKLNEIIASHGKWLRDEEGGERANLVVANLRMANLERATLEGANLVGANLEGANLDKIYYQITRIGSRNATTTYCVEDDNVLCGCWNDYKGGTLAEFEARIESVYGEQGENPNGKYYIQYMEAIKFFKAMKALKEGEADGKGNTD